MPKHSLDFLAQPGKPNPYFASSCMAKQFFKGKSVVLHLLMGPELNMNY